MSGIIIAKYLVFPFFEYLNEVLCLQNMYLTGLMASTNHKLLPVSHISFFFVHNLSLCSLGHSDWLTFKVINVVYLKTFFQV